MSYKIIFCLGLGITGISLIAMIVTFFKCNVKEIIYDLTGKKTNTKVVSRKNDYKIKEFNQEIRIRESKSDVGETQKTATIRKDYKKNEIYEYNLDSEKTGLLEEFLEGAMESSDDEETGRLEGSFDERTGVLDLSENKERYMEDDDYTDLIEEGYTGLIDEDCTGLIDEDCTGLIDEDCTGLIDEDCTGLIDDEECTGLLEEVVKERNILIIHSDIDI